MTSLPGRILVGLSFPEDPWREDFGPSESEAALVDQALTLGKQFGAGLVFVSVLEHQDSPVPGHDKTVHDVLRDRINGYFERLVARCEAADLDVKVVVRAGRAWHRLIEEVNLSRAELVMVCPKRDDGPLEQLIHGSTTERLLRKCPAPVHVVCGRAHVPPKRILVPIDFSDVSPGCIEVARALAEAGGAEVTVVHGVSYPNEIALRREADGPTLVAAYRQEVQAETRAKASALIGDADDMKVTLTDDWIVKALPGLVSDGGYDLVVMGSVGRTGIAGFLIGNTAEKIFRTVDASLWVVKPPGWQSPVT